MEPGHRRTAAKVGAERQGPAELARGVDRHVARRLKHERRFQLGGDILADDREARRGQVEIVDVEKELVRIG